VSGSPAAPQETPDLTLTRMRVFDFRSLEDVEVAFQPGSTILIGPNNAGKTALLHALGVGLGEMPDLDDVRAGSDGKPVAELQVWLEFRTAQAMSLEAEQVLRNAIVGGKVIVRTAASNESESDRLRIVRAFMPSWPVDGADRSAAPMKNATYSSRTFRKLVTWTYLDAQRDFAAQVGKLRSRLGKVLSNLRLAPADRTAIETLLSDTSKALLKSPSLVQLKADLARGVGAVNLDDSRLEIEPVPLDIERIAKSADVLLAAPDGPSLAMIRHGMGTRSLSDLLLVQATIALQMAAAAEPDTIRPLFVTAFEEPEAHLHPAAVHAVAQLIRTMPGQKVATTHATGFVQAFPLEEMVVVQRPKATTTARSLNAELKTWFSDVESLSKARRQVVLPNPDLPFARLVVLVEGGTERMTLPALFDLVAGTSDGGAGKGIVWVDMNGAGNLVRFAFVCELVGVDWVALVDDDEAGREARTAIASRWPAAIPSPLTSVFGLSAGLDFEMEVVASQNSLAILDALDDLFAGTSGTNFVVGQRKSYQLGTDISAALTAKLKKQKGAAGPFLGPALAKHVKAGTGTLPSAIQTLLLAVKAKSGVTP
jgi:putative ATP-dependent endonuclease of OLD family